MYNSVTLAMKDHLIELFGGHHTTEALTITLSANETIVWNKEAQMELGKIPGFVRVKSKCNTEKVANEQQIKEITLEIMYAAKETVGI